MAEQFISAFNLLWWICLIKCNKVGSSSSSLIQTQCYFPHHYRATKSYAKPVTKKLKKKTEKQKLALLLYGEVYLQMYCNVMLLQSYLFKEIISMKLHLNLKTHKCSFWDIFISYTTNPSLVATLWRMLQFSASQIGLLKWGKTNRDNPGLLCMNCVRSLDLKLLCLLIIHCTRVFCYITLFKIPDPSFYSEKQTRNRHKKAIFLAQWINTQKKGRINPTAEDHHSCFWVRLRMARWRDSHAVSTEASTQVGIKWT